MDKNREFEAEQSKDQIIIQQEQIAVLETAVKEKDERIESLGATAEMVMDDVRTLQEQIAILKEKREIWEERNVSLETKITDLTDELGTVKEILRQLNDRDKRMIWEKEQALRGGEVKG